MPDQVTSTALATTPLRVNLGIMFFAHGLVLNLFTFGLPGTIAFFESIGPPAFLAYLVFVAETIGGLLLILGIRTRWVALALSPILMGYLIVHSGNGWVLSAPNGGGEYPVYLFVLCVAHPGRWTGEGYPTSSTVQKLLGQTFRTMSTADVAWIFGGGQNLRYDPCNRDQNLDQYRAGRQPEFAANPR